MQASSANVLGPDGFRRTDTDERKFYSPFREYAAQFC